VVVHRYEKRVCGIPGTVRVELVVRGTGNCNRILICGKREEEPSILWLGDAKRERYGKNVKKNVKMSDDKKMKQEMYEN